MRDERDLMRLDLLADVRGATSRALASAQGAAYTDGQGRGYLDLNEMCKVLGQRNRAFTQAVTRSLEGITTDKAGFGPDKARLFQYLTDTTGGRFRAVHLTTSGSEAVEWAVRLARRMTGRCEILSFWNSIHGRTYLAGSLSGLPRRKTGYGPLAPGLVSAPYPQCVGCGQAGGCSPGHYPCLEQLKRQYRYGSAQDGAAVIVEPYLGSCVAFPPQGYLKALEQWAREQGMLFILDEVQSGMGRTGDWYCYQREGVEPDMLVLGKALGNGMHISALLLRDKPDPAFLPPVTGGVGDEATACAAACEVFRQLEGGLMEHVRRVGGGLVRGLEALRRYPCVADTAGRGLAAAVRFRGHELCRGVWRELQERGYLAGRAGDTLYCKPPYVITEEQIGAFLGALESAVSNR